MCPYRVLVVGGGVSGLALSHRLLFNAKAAGKSLHVSLVEPQKRLGGWVHTVRSDDTWNQTSNDYHPKGPESFLFELGPRSLVTRRGEETLQCIQELGLQDQVVLADDRAFKRYIWRGEKKGGLVMLPTGLNRTLFDTSHGLHRVVGPMARELLLPGASAVDESIHSFFSRRISRRFAEDYVDPLVAGVWSGDIKRLSVRSTFGAAWEAERNAGSVIRGMLAKRNQAPHPFSTDPFFQRVKARGIYSFKNGMSSLISGFEQRLGQFPSFSASPSSSPVQLFSLLRGHQVTDLRFFDAMKSPSENPVPVSARILPVGSELVPDAASQSSSDLSMHHFDHVVSTVSSSALASILSSPPSAPFHSCEKAKALQARSRLISSLASIRHASVYVVSVGFREAVLEQTPGFGFLAPSNTDLDVLGVTFDSHSFPCHNPAANSNQTRLTCMIGGDRRPDLAVSLNVQSASAIAMQALRRCLGITQSPEFIQARLMKDCIAQYDIGHHAKLRRIELDAAVIGSGNGYGEHSLASSGHFSMIGASLYGVAIPDLINKARAHADDLVLRLD